MCRSRASTDATPPPGLFLRIGNECRHIFHLAWPQTCSSVLAFSPRLFLLIAVGHLEDGAALVGSAGIGQMYSNFAHLMLIRSSTFGASSFFSQAFGAGNHARCGVILMRVLTIHTLMLICLALPLTLVAGPLLTAVGQPAAVVIHAQTFINVRLLGLPGIIILTDVQAFLNAQRCVRLPMLINLAGSLLQVCLSFGLTRALGFIGAPLAMTMVELLQVTLILNLTHHHHPSPSSSPSPSPSPSPSTPSPFTLTLTPALTLALTLALAMAMPELR